MEIISYILTIRFFIKYRFKFPTDFKIMDEELAYIKPAKLLALTTYRLLCDQAKEAKKICREFKPVFNKETYCQYIRDNFHENE